MRADKDSMLLYVVTDRTWLGENRLEDQVEAVLRSGATFLQLREKNLGFEEYLAEARSIKRLTDRYGVPFVIDDDVEVAVAADADGVHVGQSDMQALDVRKRIGAEKILGVSVRTVEQARLAQSQGADYLGVGAVFSTSTKKDADDVPLSVLSDICRAVSVPVVAIGGINAMNLRRLHGSGIDGIAVVSAIFAEPDVSGATAKLLALAGEVLR